MVSNTLHITGLPYFPGIAIGRLKKGIRGDTAQRILLIKQDEVSSITPVCSGVIVVEAVPFSHTMIGLLGLGKPTVLISAQQAALLAQEMPIGIDGSNGLITDVLDTLSTDASIANSLVPGQPVFMADNVPVNLSASVRQAAAAKQAKDLGAEAVGLVRSEFIMPEHGQLPDTAFYRKSFRELCEAASPLTVTFRLLDAAADKIPGWLQDIDAVEQVSGKQGVRLYYLDQVRCVIEAQLTALTELSSDFSLRLLVPFLTRLEEFDYWRDFVRQYLTEPIPVGAMAETPSLVLDIGSLLNDADFVAIGCNDLMQYLYAAERDQADLRHYLDPYAPLVYRMFRQVAEEAGEQIHRLHLCGVLPQIQGILPVLLGLGFRSFSVDAPFIPYLANTVSRQTIAECETLAIKVCKVKTTREVLEILQLTKNRHLPFCY